MKPIIAQVPRCKKRSKTKWKTNFSGEQYPMIRPGWPALRRTAAQMAGGYHVMKCERWSDEVRKMGDGKMVCGRVEGNGRRVCARE